MNTSTFFANPLQTVHFLSVFSSINSLGTFFYNEELLTYENTTHPISIVNVLCEYLNHNNDSDEAMIVLGHQLLDRSDLGEEETIHLDHVDAMIDNIIASTVFDQFIDVYDYLAAIENSTDDLTLSSFRREIVEDLTCRRYSNLDGSESKLTNSTIDRVTGKIIFPLFPQPENDMRIIDVDYIYAQAGLMLARVIKMSTKNTTFHQYITMSQTIEQAVLHGEMDQDALKIFQLPALLYYIYKGNDVSQKERKETKMEINIIEPQFWDDAFHLLFSDLNVSFHDFKILQEKSPAYQFQEAYSGYKSRTKLAKDTLREECPLADEEHIAEMVKDYKYHDDYSCEANKTLPKINELFSEQNKLIANKYFLFEIASIREAFGEDLIRFVEEPNVRVLRASMYFKRHTHLRPVLPHMINVNESIDLFVISQTGRRILHALVRDENGTTLISTEKGEGLFLHKIGLSNLNGYYLEFDSSPLKSGTENFTTFTTNLVKPREATLFKMLQSQGYDPTFGEKVIEFLKNLIPFRSCKNALESANFEEIALTCLLETAFMIPIFGQAAKVASKLASAAFKPMLLSLGMSIETFLARESISLALQSGIRVAALEATKIPKILTKQFFKDISIAILRTVDPGIELTLTLGRGGLAAITKCFSIVSKKIPSSSHVLQSLRNFKQAISIKVDRFENHDVFVKVVPVHDGYVIKHFRMEEPKEEFHRVFGSETKQSVLLIRGSKRGNKIYQKIDPETGKPDGKDLQLRNDVLISAPPPFAIRIKNIKEKGLTGGTKLPGHRIADREIMLAYRNEAVNILTSSGHMDEKTARDSLSRYVFDKHERIREVGVHWVAYKKFPDWCQQVEVNSVELYETLRYAPFLEDPSRLSRDTAVERILDLYAVDLTKSAIRGEAKLLFRTYLQHELQSSITFEDYYALYLWRKTGSAGFTAGTSATLRMEKAFNRLAVRQANDADFFLPKKIYRMDERHLVDLSFLVPGKIIDITHMTPFYKKMETALATLMTDRKQASDFNQFNILFEILFDNPYVAADVKRVFPNDLRQIILFPGTKFTVEKIDDFMFNHIMLKKVYLRDVPFPLGKSEMIAKLVNSIKRFEDLEIQYQYRDVVEDFDLDLLN